MSLQRRPKDTDVSSQASIISPLNPKPNKNKSKSSLVTNLEKKCSEDREQFKGDLFDSLSPGKDFNVYGYENKGSEDKDKGDPLLFDWQGAEKKCLKDTFTGDSSRNPVYDWHDPEREIESPIRHGDDSEKKCLEDKFSGDKEQKKEIHVINLDSEEGKGLGSKVKVESEEVNAVKEVVDADNYQKKHCVHNADEEDSSINPDLDFNVDVDDQAVYDYVHNGDDKEILASCNGLVLERECAKSLAPRKWLSDAVLTMCATYLQQKSKSKDGEDIFFNTYMSRKIRAFLDFEKPKGKSPTLRYFQLHGILECLLDCKKVSLQFLFGLGLSNIKAFSIMV